MSTPTKGYVTLLCGDLLTCKRQYIVHQINCTHRGQAAGLAKHLFQAYPYADTYATRTLPSTPGTIILYPACSQEQGVINLCAQYHKGKPNWRDDSAAQRQQWFQECLDAVAQQDSIQEVAFPYGIGCGLAGGSWFDYLEMITRWAARNPHLSVFIYLW